MKILKFRAWDKENKKMYTVSALYPWSNLEDPENCTCRVVGHGITGGGKLLQNPIIMQSTGLFDQNGKEIFEGDIIGAYSNEDIRVVDWHFNRFVLKRNGKKIEEFNKMFADYRKYEIIGNVHENPELLNKSK